MLTFYKIGAKHAHHRSPQYINTSQYIQQRPNTIYRIGCQLLRIANTQYISRYFRINSSPYLCEHPTSEICAQASSVASEVSPACSSSKVLTLISTVVSAVTPTFSSLTACVWRLAFRHLRLILLASAGSQSHSNSSFCSPGREISRWSLLFFCC